MNGTNSYLVDLDSAFSEVIMKGTLGGVRIDLLTSKKLMENSTIYNWTRRIEQVGSDTYNVNATVNISSVAITQTSPFELEVTLYLNYSIVSEVAQWYSQNHSIKAYISIDGWMDPAYVVETNGMYPNYITRSKTDFNEWNVSRLSDHIENATYIHWPYSKAPSFLRRFTGPPYIDSNSSCCGIHSAIRPANLSIPDQMLSYVDYLFWNNTQFTCNDIYNITYPNGQGPYTGGVWEHFRYFKLDQEHVLRYNITPEHYRRGGC
jgi:hypothetical protein